MPWTTIHLEVTTPLFNQGAGDDAGFRISSLRGAMRFWFRALAGLGIGDDLAALSKVESHVFGGTDHRSPVAMRLMRPHKAELIERPDWLGDNHEDCGWVTYLLGQSLGDMRNRKVRRPHLPPGTPIELQLRLSPDEDINALVLASLWLTCTYGGVGARTRRGFGGLRITAVDGPLPPPWDVKSLRTPRIEWYEITYKHRRSFWTHGPVESCMNPLIRMLRNLDTAFDARASSRDTPPLYPVLSRNHAQIGINGGARFPRPTQNRRHHRNADSLATLLAHTGKELRYFRARQEYLAAAYQPKLKTPEWEQVVVHRGPNSHFPLGAVGLPVVYKDGYQVNAYRRNEPLRRASPLWLRPIGAHLPDHTTEWRLLSFAFLTQFVPDNVDIQVTHHKRTTKTVAVNHEDILDRTLEWIDVLAADIPFEEHLKKKREGQY